MTELYELPQIISARTPAATDRAAKLFSLLTETTVELTPEEAELAKLFTNVWRYIKFAAVNQFYMMANDKNLDFERIRPPSPTTTPAPPTCQAPASPPDPACSRTPCSSPPSTATTSPSATPP